MVLDTSGYWASLPRGASGLAACSPNVLLHLNPIPSSLWADPPLSQEIWADGDVIRRPLCRRSCGGLSHRTDASRFRKIPGKRLATFGPGITSYPDTADEVSGGFAARNQTARIGKPETFTFLGF